jgi:hypothetical protein
VRAWGAVGDGSTDDSTEFQAAIDAAEAANGSVLVPQGTYAINAALTIDTKITMVGSGRPVLKVDSLASGSALNITGSGARGTRVEGIIIQDSSVARTKAGMSISTVAWITLRDVEFIGLLTGLTLNSVHDARGFEGLGFYENATDVLFSTTASTSITFRDSRFENTTTAIINDGNLPLTNIGFYGCGFAPTLASQGNAVEFDGTAFTNLTFSGCRFEVNTTTGKSNNLLIDGQSTSIPTTGLVIENNYFTGDAEHHVVIDTYVKNPTISGNTFFTDPNVDDIDFNPTSALFLYPIIMGNVKYHERTPNTMIVNGTIPAPKMVFDTLAYGCTGDGTVDDTTCVQAAIDAAEATGNGTVVLSGWHNVTSTITVESDGVRIVGNGTSGSNSGLLLAHTGVGLKVDAQRVYLGDFEIDGQSDTYGSPCLQLIESRQSTIERLNIYDCLTDGIRVDPEATNPAGVANWIRFRDVDVSSCGDDGIEIMTYDASTCSAENAPFDCCTGAGAGCTKTEINQHHLLFDGVNSRSNVDDGIVLRGDQQVIVGGDYGSNDVGIRFGETGDDNETENAIVKQARLEGNATSFWAAGDNASRNQLWTHSAYLEDAPTGAAVVQMWPESDGLHIMGGDAGDKRNIAFDGNSILVDDPDNANRGLNLYGQGTGAITLFADDTVVRGATNPDLMVDEGGEGTNYLRMQDSSDTVARITKYTTGGTGELLFQIFPAAGTEAVQAEFFRDTNTTGNKSIILYNGDATATQRFRWMVEAASGDSAFWFGEGGGTDDATIRWDADEDDVDFLHDTTEVMSFNATLLTASVDVTLTNTDLTVGGHVKIGSTFCLYDNGTAIFHDDDCDEVKDAGEEYINIDGRECKTIESLVSANDDDIFLFAFPENSTIRSIGCNSTAATTVSIEDYGGTDVDADLACDTDGSVTWDTSFTGTATFTSGEVLQFDTISDSTPDWTIICFTYSID